MKYILKAYLHILGYIVKLEILSIYYPFKIIGLVLEFLWDLRLPNDLKKRIYTVKMDNLTYRCLISLVTMSFLYPSSFSIGQTLKISILEILTILFIVVSTIFQSIKIHHDDLENGISIKEFFLMPNHKSEK